jgi:chemotaxis protein histidine kinase CheA
MAETEKLSVPVVPVPPVDGSAPPTPPKRSPGHRGADVKDTVAEMAAKAHEISLEAGSKMAAAMKDVVNAAAGLSGFVIESARDLVQYMVRRGQMTQEEADKLIRQVEEHQPKRKPSAPSAAAKTPAAAKSSTAAAHHPVHAAHHPVHAAHTPARAVSKPRAKAAAKKPAAKKPAAKKPAAKKPGAKKPAPKKASKPAPKKPAAKKPARKPAAKKSAKAKRR